MTRKLSKVVKNKNLQDKTKENNVNKDLINCPTNKTNNQENPNQDKPNPDQTKTLTTLQAKPMKEPKKENQNESTQTDSGLNNIFEKEL